MNKLVIVRDMKNGKEVAYVAEFGSTLGELTDRFGREVMFKYAMKGMKQEIRDCMRSLLNKGMTVADVNKKMEDWKPGKGLRKLMRRV